MSRKDWRRPSLSKLDSTLKRVKLELSYDGSLFHGFQAQDNSISVQGIIEDALEKLTGERITLFGSGRTDSGVHALCQVCHFDILKTNKIPEEKFKIALNSILPKGIIIIDSCLVDDTFHARYTTYSREYNYFIKAKEEYLPYDENYVTKIKELPSLELLNEYAALFKGTHDFTTFCSAKDICPSKYRDIYESYWTCGYDKYQKRYYKYVVVGNAFLYHQVRSMVGSMIDAALMKESVDSFKARLDKRDRSYALRTAPPCGLYLARISYDEDEYAWFEEGLDG